MGKPIRFSTDGETWHEGRLIASDVSIEPSAPLPSWLAEGVTIPQTLGFSLEIREGEVIDGKCRAIDEEGEA